MFARVNLFRADLTQLDRLDLQKQCQQLTRPPAVTPVSGTEKDALEAAINLAAGMQPHLGFLKEPIRVAAHPPSTTIILPTSVPVGLTAASSRALTLATGINLDTFAVIGPILQGGIYGSTTPELGLFGSFGAGWWTNVGIGIGPVITVIFGPPSDLAGVAFGIGCDARFMAGSIGGLLLFTPPPFRFLGFAVGLAVGPTAIPTFDVTVQVTNTVTKPLLR